jgi:hypothetical protein
MFVTSQPPERPVPTPKRQGRSGDDGCRITTDI